jgi:predicted nucleotidyltransferase
MNSTNATKLKKIGKFKIIMILPRVQAIVNRITEECHHRFGNKATLIWFGSWIKGTAYPQSDIDLAIEHHGKLTQKEIVAFRNWLDDFMTLYTIDLVDMKVAGESLTKEIKRYGKRL